MDKPKYLVNHGTPERPQWTFQPKSSDKVQFGWSNRRLRDEFGQSLTDQAEAFTAGQACADIYERWRNGDHTVGPLWIDENGRVRPPASKPSPATARRTTTPAIDVNDVDPLTLRYALGTAGSIIVDYVASEFFPTNVHTARTYRNNARICLRRWGTRPWLSITPKEAREAIMRIIEDHPTMGVALCGFMRVAFNTTRLMYDNPRHPNRVVHDTRNVANARLLETSANPFTDLQLPSLDGERVPWPLEWIQPMVKLCDKEGFPSLGDGILFNSWLGQRLNDLISLPDTYFDLDRELTFRQSKTRERVILPWQDVPELVERYHASQQRRAAMLAKAGTPTVHPRSRHPKFLRPTTFVYEDLTGGPFIMETRRINKIFDRLRDSFAESVEPTRVDFAVEHFEHDPFLYDPQRIVLGALRHTAVTQLGRAGVSAHDIACITGHSEKTVLDILRHYRKATIAGARRAFSQRLAYESAGK